MVKNFRATNFALLGNHFFQSFPGTTGEKISLAIGFCSPLKPMAGYVLIKLNMGFSGEARGRPLAAEAASARPLARCVRGKPPSLGLASTGGTGFIGRFTPQLRGCAPPRTRFLPRAARAREVSQVVSVTMIAGGRSLYRPLSPSDPGTPAKMAGGRPSYRGL